MAHSIFSLKKMSKSDLKGAYNHNKRELEVANADESKRDLNVELVETGGLNYTKLIENRMEETASYRTRSIRKDAVYAFSVVLAIPQERANDINVNEWSKKSMEWLDKTFNQDKEKFGNNIVSATLHMDESSPHIHAIISPVDRKGHYSAYEFVNGPASLRQMHTSYAEEMKEFGLERGKKYSVAKHTDLKQFYTKLNEAVQTKAPEIQSGDTLESYQKKCEQAIQNIAVRFLAEEEKQNKERNEAVSGEHEKTVEAKLELKEAHKEIKQLNHKLEKAEESIDFLEKENKKQRDELDELERGAGISIKDIIEKVHTVDAIAEAIKDISDPEEQQHAREFMNKLIRDGRRKKRMMKERTNNE